MARVFLSLGSNIGDRAANITQAVSFLIIVSKTSSPNSLRRCLFASMPKSEFNHILMQDLTAVLTVSKFLQVEAQCSSYPVKMPMRPMQ